MYKKYPSSNLIDLKREIILFSDQRMEMKDRNTRIRGINRYDLCNILLIHNFSTSSIDKRCKLCSYKENSQNNRVRKRNISEIYRNRVVYSLN